jgi:hypothetical protein
MRRDLLGHEETRSRRIVRRDRLEISDSFSAPRSGQREHGALRVDASDDPAAAQRLCRALEDAAAAGRHALRRRVDVVDVEVVKPERHGHRRRLGGHTADRLPAGGEQLIAARGADVGADLLPAEKLAVKGKRLPPVGGEQFVPADAARRSRRGALLLARREPLE